MAGSTQDEGRIARTVRRWSDKLDAFTVKFYGPAQVGRADEAPVEHVEAAPCPLCGLSMSRHELIRRNGMARMYCPEVPADEAADPQPAEPPSR